jgi:uncharacterized protein (DUF3820 family)
VAAERVFSNGVTHIEQRCSAGHFIKFLPQGRPINVMPFGKHKGAPIGELPGDYLNWVLENLVLKGSLLRALEAEFERRGLEGA